MLADIFTIARWSRVRLMRGKLLWIAALLAGLPPLLAFLAGLDAESDALYDHVHRFDESTELLLRFVAQLGPALLLANGLGEELELRTYTYLWSRPMRREALLFGKLAGALPILLGVTLLSTALAYVVALGGYAGGGLDRLAQVAGAAVATCVAGSCFAIGIGALVPKHPFVLALGVLAGAQVLAIVPNVSKLSISFHARALAGLPPDEGLTESTSAGASGLVVLTAIWLIVAFWRARRAELAAIDV